MVVRHLACLALMNLAGGSRERIPDRGAAPLFIDCPFDLIRSRCGPPEKIAGKNPCLGTILLSLRVGMIENAQRNLLHNIIVLLLLMQPLPAAHRQIPAATHLWDAPESSAGAHCAASDSPVRQYQSSPETGPRRPAPHRRPGRQTTTTSAAPGHRCSAPSRASCPNQCR